MQSNPLGTLGTSLRRAACALLVIGTWACAGAGPASDGPRTEPPAPGLRDADAVHAVLDDWHAAASEADQARYLGHFTPDAVFLGTDPGERWTLAEFRGYVETWFPRGGWTYHPHDRHVRFSDDGRCAWFDEGLTHASYGELRGTGVLRLHDGTWRLAHYSMTFTIPNAVAREVIRFVEDARAAGEDG